TLSPELQKVRAALEKYQDPVVAVHDGYFSTLACVEYLKGGEGSIEYTPGGMGVHFLNLQFIGPTLDPAKPQVLIYEPDGDKLRLVAAEWFGPVDGGGAGGEMLLTRRRGGAVRGHDFRQRTPGTDGGAQALNAGRFASLRSARPAV